jgi:hypothetical protein
VLYNCVLEKLVVEFNYLFSFLTFNFGIVTDFGLTNKVVDVQFLSLSWMCNLAITNSQVQCQASCLYII